MRNVENEKKKTRKELNNAKKILLKESSQIITPMNRLGQRNKTHEANMQSPNLYFH